MYKNTKQLFTFPVAPAGLCPVGSLAHQQTPQAQRAPNHLHQVRSIQAGALVTGTMARVRWGTA